MTSFRTITFSNYGSVCLEFCWRVTYETILIKKRINRPVFVKMNSIFLLAAGANSLEDSFPYKYMLYLLSLIWTAYGEADT